MQAASKAGLHTTIPTSLFFPGAHPAGLHVSTNVPFTKLIIFMPGEAVVQKTLKLLNTPPIRPAWWR